MSYISLTQKPIAVKVWEKWKKKNTLNFCIKRILSSYHAKVFHFPRYTSLHSTKQEWVWMWKILEITLDPNINSIYIISLRHAAQTPKAGGSKKNERRTLEITTKIVEIGLKLPLDRNNMKIFILYQGEIEKKRCASPAPAILSNPSVSNKIKNWDRKVSLRFNMLFYLYR